MVLKKGLKCTFKNILGSWPQGGIRGSPKHATKHIYLTAHSSMSSAAWSSSIKHVAKHTMCDPRRHFFISYTFAWYNFCDHLERPISLSLFLCMSLPGELLLLESFKHIIDSLDLRTWSTHIAHTYSTQIARTCSYRRHTHTTHTAQHAHSTHTART